MSEGDGRIRVLQAVYGLDVGGIEKWLVQLLCSIDRERFAFDLAVIDPDCDGYASEVTHLGARILPLPLAPALSYPRRFAELVHEWGPYDVIHSSLGVHNGVMMWLAARNGIPVRISHSRNTLYSSALTLNPLVLPRRLAQRAYVRLLRHWMRRYCTQMLGVSELAAECLFGAGVRDDPRYLLMPSSIDTSEFRGNVPVEALRQEFALPETARVVGHVGRFAEQKNHGFLVDIARETVARDPSVHFMLIGDGPLRPEVEAKVAALGLSDSFRFTGSRHDVPDLMRGLLDLFLLPSRFEGLGRVTIEAQLAGLPCLISDVCPEEVDLVPALIRRLPLEAPAAEWADHLLQLLREPPRVSSPEAIEIVEGTVFNMTVAARELERIYAQHR